MDSHFSSMLSMLLCLETHNIILLRTCFAFPWSGSRISRDSQSIVNAHVLQARIEELVNTYPNSFFLILLCKVMNIVLNNVHIAFFINLLVSAVRLYRVSLKCYGIDLWIKLAKYFMTSSACKPKLLSVRIKYWQGFIVWE